MTKKHLILYWVLAGVIALSYFCFCAEVFGQWQSGAQPMLGRQIDWAHPLSKGFVGLWLFNEGSGNRVNDLSGNRTIFDDWTNSPVWVPGGLDFENAVTTQWITSNSPAISAIGTGNYTLILGLKVEAYNVNNCGTFTFGVFDPSWVMDSSGHPYIYDGGNKTASSGVVPIGVDTVVAYVREGTGAGQLKYYIDGVSAGTSTHSDSINAPSTVTIGSDRDSSSIYDYDGVVRFVYLYNRALTSSEVSQLYREPFCMFEGDLTVAQMYDYGEAPAPSGQFITIQMSVIPLFILFTAICFVKGRK